jgi:hypothetical protein
MKESRGVIGHFVQNAWLLIVEGNVTVIPLVEGLLPQECRRWGCSGDGTVPLSIECAEVVRPLFGRLLPYVETLCGGFIL